MATYRDLSNICNIMYQTRRRQLFTMPLVRYNPESPYPSYTTQQLDMRRKVEVLKNKPSSINSLSNTLTQKQQLSRILSGTTKSNNLCLSDYLLSTPSYKSDVPGPIVNLQLDPTIPLYKYHNNGIVQIDSLGENQELLFNFLWSINANYNILTNTGNEIALFSMFITKNIIDPYYIFNINVPFAIRINGNYNGATSFNYYITSAYLNIYYSGTPVNIGTTNNIYQVSTSDISYNFTVDVSNVFITNNYNASYNNFSTQLFVGNLLFKNIKLQTQINYIYDFTLIVNIGFIPITTSVQINPRFQVYTIANFTNDISLNYVKNCITTVKNTGQNYTPFSISV